MPDAANNLFKVYQLNPDGKNYRAAATVYRLVEMAFAAQPIVQVGRNLGDIHRDFSEFYQGLYTRLHAKKLDLLQETGLLSPTIQITTYTKGLPRAYETYPTIYVADGLGKDQKHPPLYLYAPVDYRGDYFVPKEARLLDKKETEAIGQYLFAGGWTTPASVFQMSNRGVETPKDFDPKIHQALKGSYKSDRTQEVFVADGRSLEWVRDYQSREKVWSAACHNITEALKKAALSAESPEMSKWREAGEGFYVNTSYSYGGALGGATEFSLSVRQEGKTNLMLAGQPVKLTDNKFFLVGGSHGGDYKVRPNEKTNEGQELKKLFDAVPPRPELSDYPELRGNFRVKQDSIDQALGINGVIPQVRTLHGVTLLIYNRDLGTKSSFAPPGAHRLDTALYIWLDKDESDRNLNIEPPPRSSGLQRLFERQMKPYMPKEIEGRLPARSDLPFAKKGSTDEPSV